MFGRQKTEAGGGDAFVDIFAAEAGLNVKIYLDLWTI